MLHMLLSIQGTIAIPSLHCNTCSMSMDVSFEVY
jgi:hypothetical protein